MINARVETVAEKPAYRRAFSKRRCLLPANGFYEWQPVAATDTTKAHKQPYFSSPEDGQVMALAGLYEFWRAPGVDDDPAAWWATCTIITTEAADVAGRVHPRMPLAIASDGWNAWLDPGHQDTDELRALLGAPAAGHLGTRAVSTAVNNVRNNGPHLLDAAGGRSVSGLQFQHHHRVHRRVRERLLLAHLRVPPRFVQRLQLRALGVNGERGQSLGPCSEKCLVQLLTQSAPPPVHPEHQLGDREGGRLRRCRVHVFTPPLPPGLGWCTVGEADRLAMLVVDDDAGEARFAAPVVHEPRKSLYERFHPPGLVGVGVNVQKSLPDFREVGVRVVPQCNACRGHAVLHSDRYRSDHSLATRALGATLNR